MAHSPFYSRALFLSLLNTACAYDPVGLGIPYNYMLFADTREPLVEVPHRRFIMATCFCLSSISCNSSAVNFVSGVSVYIIFFVTIH